ncbi:zinc finger protein 423 homolog [Orussus abietinus]|uniref:zinc finger protein 423 homolog n=1 Tax=Orussus abietinus TaxID=222816 RepID=UPI000C716167|nr:zinc finger protein 423 homolog [Orussus abietinus]
MSRRKQAKPRSLKRDEEWDDANGRNAPDTSDRNDRRDRAEPLPMKQAEEEEEEEDEELQRAFGRHSVDYLQDGGPPSVPGADLENRNSPDSEASGSGSSSWRSDSGGAAGATGRPASRRGETPSSCATPTSASFPSEPEVDNEPNDPAAPYPCQFCDRTFPRLSYLKKHEQSHGDQMPYRCSWCARLFKHKRSRDRHVKLHTGDRRYRCPHCEAAFSRSDHLKIHMKTHDTQKPYQCTACSRGYNTAAALTSHMQSHKKHPTSGGGSLSGSKDLGDPSDPGRRSVSSHSASSPPMASSPSPSSASRNHCPTKNPQLAISTSTTPILSSPLKLACMYCTRDSFTSMQQLQMHVHTMHRAILSGESLTVPSPSPGRTSEASNASRVLERQDKIEGQEKSSRDQERRILEDRERKRARDGGFSCGQCTMRFSGLNSLRDHLVTIHRMDGFGSALMMCPLCGIPCSSAASYAEHYVLRHCENQRMGSAESSSDFETGNGAFPRSRETKGADMEPADLTSRHLGGSSDGYSAGTLLCGQCGAALKDFESFREHLAGHLQADHRTQETPGTPCPKCEVTFHDREEMLAHLTKHYLGPTTKEYACGACNKFYPHPDLLQRHLLDSHAHHLYRCALCRDTFDSRVAIQVHFAVKHSQECRVYRCNTCSGSKGEVSPSAPPTSTSDRNGCFASEAEMANHVRTVHAPPKVVNESPGPVPGRGRDRGSPISVSNPAIPVHGSNPRCVFCGLCCSSDLELQLHLASHSSALFRCPVCREGFAVEFLLDRHIAQVHHQPGERQANARHVPRENGRIHHRPPRIQEDSKSQKRGRSPASSNNNSLNQRDNNNKRANLSLGVQQCELCERGEFANEAELQAHKKLAHAPVKLPTKSLPSLSLTCAYCGEVCRSRSELESHTRIQHASNEPGGRHKCNICDEVCPSGASLAEHKLRKHCKIQLSDTCVVCRGLLGSEGQFLEHMQRHSLENVDPQQRLDGALPHLPAPCVVCRQTLVSDLECRLHARHHLGPGMGSRSSGSSPSPGRKPQNPACCLCLREFPPDDFVGLTSSHSGTGGQPLRVCKPCYVRHSQGLPILHSPYEHVGSSKGDKTWDGVRDQRDGDGSSRSDDNKPADNALPATADNKRCGDCGVKFEAPEDAEKHKAAEHYKTTELDKVSENGPNTYTCIQCQVSYPTEAGIRQHVRKEHLESSDKGSLDALRCHLCLFEANSPLQLQGHLIEHTFAGCAALSCYICQALFTAPIGLQNHMLQQHGLGARPYDCSHCGLKFFFRAELDHHAVTFHRRNDPSSPEKGSKGPEEQPKKAENQDIGTHDSGVTVKEELTNAEEEEVNVDGHAEQERLEDSLENQDPPEEKPLENQKITKENQREITES